MAASGSRGTVITLNSRNSLVLRSAPPTCGLVQAELVFYGGIDQSGAIVRRWRWILLSS